MNLCYCNSLRILMEMNKFMQRHRLETFPPASSLMPLGMSQGRGIEWRWCWVHIYLPNNLRMIYLGLNVSKLVSFWGWTRMGTHQGLPNIQACHWGAPKQKTQNPPWVLHIYSSFRNLEGEKATVGRRGRGRESSIFLKEMNLMSNEVKDADSFSF